MRNKIIIVEGAQGVGKTTVTNILRDSIPYTNLMRLTGNNTKGEEAKSQMEALFTNLLRMFRGVASHNHNFILDRFFFSDEVFAKLYKGYKVDSNTLYRKLWELTFDYDIYVFHLICSPEEMGNRLRREKPNYQDVSFSMKESLRQEEEYATCFNELRNYKGIVVHSIDTSEHTSEQVATIIKELSGA